MNGRKALKQYHWIFQKLQRGAQIAELWLNAGRRLVPHIETINFMITDRCNGKCVFCNIGRGYNGADMAMHEIIEGIHETFPYLKMVSITGGEPMIRRDLGQISHELQEEYSVNTVTNGQLPQRVKEFVDLNPNAVISTSLHGIGELHDRCMGIKGAFKNFLKTIDHIPGKTGAGMTVCRLNYNKITEVYDFLKDLGLYFAVNVMDISELYYQNSNLHHMLPTEEMKQVMIEQMQQVRTTQELWKELQMEFLMGHRRDFDCWSGRLQVFIHNSGRIYPCIYMDKVIESLQLGSLQERSVQQINMAPCRKCLTHCEAMTSINVALGRQYLLDKLRGRIRRRFI